MIQVFAFTFASFLLLFAGSCAPKNNGSRPNEDVKEASGYIDTTEEDFVLKDGGKVSVGQTTVSFPIDAADSGYRVRLSRSMQTPQLSDLESEVLGSPQSDIVLVEVYDSLTSVVLSSDQLKAPYEFEQSFPSSSATDKIGLMIVSDPDTTFEQRTLLPRSELTVSNSPNLNLIESQTVTISVNLKLTNAVVWVVPYTEEAMKLLKIGTSSSVGSIGGSTVSPISTISSFVISDASISIDSGSSYTSSESVTLGIVATGATEMYITTVPGCATDGIWENFSSSKSWTLNNLNSVSRVYAKFRTSSGDESGCLSSAIIHDDISPHAPGVVDDGSIGDSLTNSLPITWSAGTDSGSGIARYEVAIGSSAGGTDLKSWTTVGDVTSSIIGGLNLTADETYYASVRTVDAAGNVSSATEGDGWITPGPTISNYVIRGTTTASTIDGAAQTFCGGDGLCPSSGDAYTIPDGVTIGTLQLEAGAYVKISSSNTATIRAVSISGNSTLLVDKDVTFDSLNVSNGTVTATGFSGSWSGSAWNPIPAIGNGKLSMTVTGNLTIGSSGKIEMNGKGFKGATVTRYQGQSYSGPGAASNAANGCGGAGHNSGHSGVHSNAGGGSYGNGGGAGSVSAGAAFGSSDFWTQLYIGCGGGAGYETGSNGGNAGGALKLNVGGALSNSGIISATGNAASLAVNNYEGGSSNHYGGGGSGGTLYIIANNFSNTGTLSTAGGTSGSSTAGGLGRIRIEAVSFGTQTGTSVGVLDPASFLSALDLAGQTVTLTISSVGATTLGLGGNDYSLGIISTSEEYSSLFTQLSSASQINIVSAAATTYLTPTLANLGTFTVATSKTATVTGNFNSSGASITVNGTMQVNGTMDLSSLTVSSGGIVTSSTFAGTWVSGAWSPVPAPGNGQLIINASGNITVESGGKIHMDAKGYYGGTEHFQGSSPLGPGASGEEEEGGSYQSANGGGGGASLRTAFNYNHGGGGSYGSAGGAGSGSIQAGSTYGAADFWTALHLGSGGGGVRYMDDARTGNGGGAIKLISGGTLSNAGTISALGGASRVTVYAYEGGSATLYPGAGSGGTISLGGSDFVNTGTISTAGGTSGHTNVGGSGRVRVQSTSYSNSGTIIPTLSCGSGICVGP
jgi:hypothetical protein